MIVLRTSVRYMLRHPWQIGLCVLGVALGVAVVVAIDLATASASRAFALSTESVAGRATHQIVGGPAGLDEALYARLRVGMAVRPSAPVVEGYAVAPALGGMTVHLLGVDPFAEGPFRAYLGGPGVGVGAGAADATVDLSRLLVEPGAVLMSAPLAAQYGLAPGDTLALRLGARTVEARVAGLLQPSDDLSARALEGLLVADIATAQELLGMVGRLSRIDLILEADAASAAAPQAPGPEAAIAAVLPPGASIERAAARSGALEQMTRAFELNLTALSLLALIVGMFLIYNTVTFSVVQRRGLLGTLRCVGVTRGQILAMVLGEAALISLAGSLLGLGLGVLLGRGLVVLVTRTINDLYFTVTVRGLSVEPAVLLKGLLLGVGATLLAAAVPALEAMRTPPRTVLRRSSAEERMRRAVPRAALAGLAVIGLGVALLWAPSLQIVDCRLQIGPLQSAICNLQSEIGGLYLAFGSLFMIVIGAALLSPALMVGLMALAGPPLGRAFGLLGRMAARDVVAALSRTAVAVAALMVAISVTIGVGVMVGSFRQTVISWLDQSLVADVYVSAPGGTANRASTTLDPALVEALAGAPGVAADTRFRSVQVDAASGPTTLVAVRVEGGRGRSALRFLEGGDAASWGAWDGGAIFVSEPLAYRTGLGAGDSLELPTDRGPQQFPIAGVYYDYSSDRGVIRMADATYRAMWDDPAVSSLALYAADGQDVDGLIAELRQIVAGWPGGPQTLTIRSNAALRAGTLEVFDRTFAITAVLQLLATAVAFIGILSALMALQLERARELGMLRATGLTPGQLWGVVLGQTGLMGLAAGLLATPLGLGLAVVLVYVINKRSFGWTLDLSLSPAVFGQALLVAMLAALLAGVYPAYAMSRTSPALALREE
ncbi:FtsX-like permease family protein [Oscillochloris sp. ZM17-4]|uniref:FtsX-like permease family protein n=1 Tax=Oscillochloris sp. ZM17-4 TaxID=2866714 RepID=UPI0021029FA3|nr:ABC transporter permease [Oscillochloris sp. ZM17-4]